MRNFVCLKSINSGKGLRDASGTVSAQFLVGSDNQTSTLEQTLYFKSDAKGWTASMDMEGFPHQKSAEDAAEKLADWMERMAEAIRSGEYSNINLNNL